MIGFLKILKACSACLFLSLPEVAWAQANCVPFKDQCVKTSSSSLFLNITSETDDLTGIEVLDWIEFVRLKGDVSDPNDVNLSALSGLPHLTKLSLENVTATFDLGGQPLALKDLTVNGGQFDVAQVQDLPTLTTLSLFNLGSLAPIDFVKLPNLIGFSVLNTPFDDIIGLADAPRLTHLTLANAGITDVTPLAQLGLKVLRLRGAGLTDLTPLGHQEDLEVLNLNGSEVTTLAGMTFGSSLKTLSASNSALQDISALKTASGLKTLRLNGSKVTNVKGIADLTMIDLIDLRETPLRDLSALGPQPALRHLALSDSTLEDLSPLAALTSVEELALSRIPATDISALASMTNLAGLWLNKTKATDLTPLLALENFEGMAIDGRRIFSKEGLRAFVESFPE